MSATLSPDLLNLERIVIQQFTLAQDGIAEDFAREWKAQIVELDVIDTGTYLGAVAAGEPIDSGEARTITIEAPAARGYSALQEERGGRPGKAPVKHTMEASEPFIRERLDDAGREVSG